MIDYFIRLHITSNYCIVGYVGKIGSLTKISFKRFTLFFSKTMQQNLLPVLNNTEIHSKKNTYL